MKVRVQVMLRPAVLDPQGKAIGNALAELRGLDRATILRLRREKFSAIGRTLS